MKFEQPSHHVRQLLPLGVTEMALKIVMLWLSAQDVGQLARTCRVMAEAARLVTNRRLGDATQGWENIAVPIENHVDNCLYPEFQYTPFSRVSGPPFGGPWGGGEDVAETRRRGASESEFGGAMVSGSVLLGPVVGCRCPGDCSSVSNGFFDGSSPEVFIEEGGRTSGSLARRQHDSHTLELLEEGLKKTKKKRTFEEHSGDSAYSQRSLHDPIEEEDSIKEVPGSCETLSIHPSSCLCGRFIGGELAYDGNSCLRIPDVKRGKNSTEVAEGQDGSRAHAIVEETGILNGVLHQDVVDSGEGRRDIHDPPLVMECGQVCSCSCLCKYRVSQNGLAVRVKVVRTSFKGWGLCAKQDITHGSFVCEYAGELITTSKARERQKLYDTENHGKHWQGSALLTVREHLPSGQASVRVNVDATRVGNVARFINHSCDGGNLVPCLIRTAGCVIPKLALFARRAIPHEEELSYSYGISDADAESWKPCFCGSSACRGRLPSECT